MYDSVNFHLTKLFCQTKKKAFTVKCEQSDDCGVFAVAYCTSLAYGQNPSLFVYDIVMCFKNKKMEPFPVLREQRLGKSSQHRLKRFAFVGALMMAAQ